MNQRIAVIEFVTSTPHLETSLEIALQLAREGEKVDYFHLASSLPFRDFNRDFPLFDATIKDKLQRILFWKVAPHKLGMQLAKDVALRENLDVTFNEVKKIKPKKRNNSRSSNFSNFEELKKSNSVSTYMGFGLANSLIGIAKTTTPQIEDFTRVIQRIYKSYRLTYDWCIELFGHTQYDKVVLFNGRFASSRAIQDAATIMNVPRAFHERGGSDNLGYFFEDFSPHTGAGTREWFEDNWKQEEAQNPNDARTNALSLFDTSNRGKNIEGKTFNESPSLTSWESNQVRPQRFPGKLRVVYFSSTDEEFGFLGPEAPFSTYQDQKIAVMRLAELSEDLDFDLIVRVHPNMHLLGGSDKDWWDYNNKLQDAKNVTLIPSFSPINSHEILLDVDLVISWHSTLGLESLLYGVPSLNLCQSQYFISGATVSFPESDEELVNILQTRTFIHPDPESVLPFASSIFRSRSKYVHFEPDGAYGGTFCGVALN